MELFDEFERTFKGRANHDHSSYDFINKSTWPAAVYIRELLSKWSLEFPVDADFLSRFRSDNYQKHLGAFFEIVIYTWLKYQNFNVRLHEVASLSSQRRPDFAISKAPDDKFYAECTLAALPDYDPGIERLKNQITDALEGIESPEYALVIDFEKSSTVSLSKKKLIRFVQQILGEGLSEDESLDWNSKAWTLKDSGWQIEFKIFRKPKGVKRTVGMIHNGPAGIIYSEKPLRASLDRKKGSNYGSLENPYVICINSCDFYLDSLSVMQTLFGSWSRSNGFSLNAKESDGFFLRNGKPLNTSVSAALIVNNIVPWNLHVAKAELWHNPFATRPLSKVTLDLPEISFKKVNGNDYEMEYLQGQSIGEILRIKDDYMRNDVE